MEVFRALDDQLALGLLSPAVFTCHCTTVMLCPITWLLLRWLFIACLPWMQRSPVLWEWVVASAGDWGGCGEVLCLGLVTV